MGNRLDRDGWISAGLRALRDGGIEAVRVEPLAKALGVTKGSFYWHFADRPALLAALLEAWEIRATDAVIKAVDAGVGHARETLVRLFRTTLAADGRLERAVRDWAARDPVAAAAQARVDRRRIDHVAALITALGLPPEGARRRATLAYLALIGHYALQAGAGPPNGDEGIAQPMPIDELVDLLTQPV